jgi:hypothetical protein
MQLNSCVRQFINHGETSHNNGARRMIELCLMKKSSDHAIVIHSFQPTYIQECNIFYVGLFHLMKP